jgi:hypothetical protein
MSQWAYREDNFTRGKKRREIVFATSKFGHRSPSHRSQEFDFDFTHLLAPNSGHFDSRIGHRVCDVERTVFMRPAIPGRAGSLCRTAPVLGFGDHTVPASGSSGDPSVRKHSRSGTQAAAVRGLRRLILARRDLAQKRAKSLRAENSFRDNRGGDSPEAGLARCPLGGPDCAAAGNATCTPARHRTTSRSPVHRRTHPG